MRYNTIFHIDDDQDDIDFFAATVEQLSKAVNCFSFTEATIALQELIKGTILPDAIFLDLNMPRMNGQEFLLKLKDIALLKDISVVILSTSSDFYTIQELKAR